MDNTEVFEFEDRSYLNPTKSRDEQMDFIDTLRETMTDKQNQVNQSTYALGTQIPARYGGLQGGGQTFEARYRTPQLNQTAANLRTAAQQSALNTALSNLQSAWKKRYNDAVLAYQRRAATPTSTPSSNSGGDDGLPINTNGTDEVVVSAGEKTESQQQLDTAQNNAQNWGNNQLGSGVGNSSTVIMYKVNGTPQYATIYRGPNNQFLGIETPGGSYNSAYGQNFLNQLAKNNNLFNTSGVPVTSMEAFSGLGGL